MALTEKKSAIRTIKSLDGPEGFARSLGGNAIDHTVVLKGGFVQYHGKGSETRISISSDDGIVSFNLKAKVGEIPCAKGVQAITQTTKETAPGTEKISYTTRGAIIINNGEEIRLYTASGRRLKKPF